MHAMQDWADTHPEYKDKTWDVINTTKWFNIYLQII